MGKRWTKRISPNKKLKLPGPTESGLPKTQLCSYSKLQKQKAIIEAQAEAEKIREKAKGEADAIFAKLEAEARGMYEILTKQAEGLDRIVKAAGNNPKMRHCCSSQTNCPSW